MTCPIERQRQAGILIEAVCDQLHGITEILRLLRAHTDVPDKCVLDVIESALGEQVDVLERDLLPLVAPVTVPMCVMAANLDRGRQ